MQAAYNVLFLCTGNSARSIIAEAILNRVGGKRLRAYSAGSNPKGAVNPHALKLLESLDYDTRDLHSKSWNEFARPAAPKFSFILTLCDDAANETCPIWPGHPATAHWGIPDPAAAQGSDAEVALAFAGAYRMLNNRIVLLTGIPIESLDRTALQQRLREIGRTDDRR